MPTVSKRSTLPQAIRIFAVAWKDWQFNLDPYDKDTLFLFCGKRTDRIKGLLWEGDGFLLLYKRLYSGAFQWPRSADEAKEISPDQYKMLMQGLEIIAKRPIEQIENPPCAM